jgi:hypothetical protein
VPKDDSGVLAAEVMFSTTLNLPGEVLEKPGNGGAASGSPGAATVVCLGCQGSSWTDWGSLVRVRAAWAGGVSAGAALRWPI